MESTRGQHRGTKATLAGDVLVVGAGTAGMPAAIFAARRARG
ncbi:MAG: FAD-binding protein [Paracoccaceae bacterium]